MSKCSSSSPLEFWWGFSSCVKKEKGDKKLHAEYFQHSDDYEVWREGSTGWLHWYRLCCRKQSLYKTNYNPTLNSGQCINTWQSSLLISSSQSKCMHCNESRPYAPNPTFPFCDRVTPDFFYYHVPLKNENYGQETQLKSILTSRKSIPVLWSLRFCGAPFKSV